MEKALGQGDSPEYGLTGGQKFIEEESLNSSDIDNSQLDHEMVSSERSFHLEPRPRAVSLTKKKLSSQSLLSDKKKLVSG